MIRLTSVFIFLIGCILLFAGQAEYALAHTPSTDKCAGALSDFSPRKSFEEAFPPEAWTQIGENFVVGRAGSESLRTDIEAMLRSAKTEIEIQLRSLRDPAIINIIREKALENVKIRILASDPKSNGVSSKVAKEDAELEQELSTLPNVKFLFYPNKKLAQRSSLIHPENHRKIFTVDGHTAFIGSLNLTQFRKNIDIGAFVRGPIVSALRHITLIDWINSDGDPLLGMPDLLVDGLGDTSIEVLGAKGLGVDIRTGVLDVIENAKTSLTLIQYELQDKTVIRALIEKKEKYPNMRITVLLGPHSMGASFLGLQVKQPLNVLTFAKLFRAGIDVRWASTKKGDFVHGKGIIADGETIVFGSADFTPKGFEGNLEADLHIRSAEVAGPIESVILEAHARGDKTFPSAFSLLNRAINETFIDLAINFNFYKNLINRVSSSYLDKSHLRIVGRQLWAHLQKAIEGKRGVKAGDLFTDVNLATSTVQKRIGVNFEIPAQSHTNSGKVYLFAGISPSRKKMVEKFGFSASLSGDFGPGIYLASNPTTSVDYTLLRSHQEKSSEGNLYVIAADLGRPMILSSDWPDYYKWVRSKYEGYIQDHLWFYLEEYARKQGFNSVIVDNYEGAGNHYIIFFDPSRLEVVRHFQWQFK